MSIRVLADVWEASAQKGGNLLVLLALADYADDRGRSWPSVQTLATKARMSERNARYVLRTLEEAGEIETIRGGTNKGATKPSVYRILIGRQDLPRGNGLPNPGQPAAPEPSKEPSVAGEEPEVAVAPLFASPSTLSASRPTGPIMEDVRYVFEHWKLACGKNGNCHLTDERIRVIRKALKTYPKPELLLAVKGWRYSPFHRGENEDDKVWNELELLLRNAANIEKFRDLAIENERRGPGREAELRRSLRETAESMGISESEVMRIQSGRFDALVS